MSSARSTSTAPPSRCPRSAPTATRGSSPFDGFADWSFDAALSRIFELPGTHRLEARVEAFNLTNAVRPNNPSVTLSAATFGRVTAVQDPRIMQFALKYIF